MKRDNMDGQGTYTALKRIGKQKEYMKSELDVRIKQQVSQAAEKRGIKWSKIKNIAQDRRTWKERVKMNIIIYYEEWNKIINIKIKMYIYIQFDTARYKNLGLNKLWRTVIQQISSHL